jgi:hypothetical protein
MARQALLSIGARFGAGHGLWSIVAFVFPTVAIVKDDSVALAMLLFVVETLLASALLAVRLLVTRRALARDDHARRRLNDIRNALLFFVTPFSLACAVMVGAATFIEVANGRASYEVWAYVERARWMAAMLLASAVLDSLIAPVRSVHWLETGVAWQGSRTAVLFLCVLLGWPVMLFTGTTQAFFWIFFALRLLTDVGSLKPGERERIRTNMFGPAYAPTAPVAATAEPETTRPGTQPPPFSPAHARHDMDHPRRTLP